MGKTSEPLPVKLIIGQISSGEKFFDLAERWLIKKFGPVDYRSPVLPFDYTDYYASEMGPKLKRRFVSFRKLIFPQRLAGIKVFTNQLEEKLVLAPGKRRINLDPGYLDLAKLVLASTKDFSQRIYLGRGIYAEITLIYKKGLWQVLEWTYPDYRSPAYQEIFNHIRQRFKEQII